MSELLTPKVILILRTMSKDLSKWTREVLSCAVESDLMTRLPAWQDWCQSAKLCERSMKFFEKPRIAAIKTLKKNRPR